MRIKSLVANSVTLLGSLALGAILCEVGSRAFLNPADYLSANTVRDDVLGVKVSPGAAGFDEWGFRNRKVPPTADVVAIGDSHTYGNAATMTDSWPYVVGRLTGLSVYNLGLGGYGPNQYYYLFKTRALALKPRWILCGLYMGDDFQNAFTMTYGKDYWAFLRRGHWSQVDADIWEVPDTGSWHKAIRVWLSQHSLVYQVLVHGPVLGWLTGSVQIAQAARGRDQSTETLTVETPPIREVFRPLAIRDRLDRRSPMIVEGARITLDLLKQMSREAHESGAEFIVVVIPTKETVFAEYLKSANGVRLRKPIEQLVADERVATAELLSALNEAGVAHVETLSALRTRVGSRLYARSDRDMHPAGNGYRVIGETVATFLHLAK